MAAVVLTLVLAVSGTLWGTDDDFPFGPFRMYSTRGDPDGTVRELRVRVVMPSGTLLDVTNASDAPRRAELEGRIDRLSLDQRALAALIPPFVRGIAPRPVSLQLVWELHPLRAGRSGPSSTLLISSVPVPP
jgi:hypothetical protein